MIKVIKTIYALNWRHYWTDTAIGERYIHLKGSDPLACLCAQAVATKLTVISVSDLVVTAMEGNNRLRSTNFKNKGKDAEEMRRRRNEMSVELRKNKRDETLLKRRNVPVDCDAYSETDAANDYISLQSIVVSAASDNIDEQLNAVKAARKL
ncbi:unnamed protein product, partial [Oppiella nova]